MYSSTNPNQLKKKNNDWRNTNFIYKGYCHESVQRFSFAKHPHCLRPRPIPVPVFAHTNGYCYKGTQTRATKQIHLCLMLSIRREEKTYLCFRNRVTRTLSSGRGDHEFKLRTVSFSFRDSLILTFVSCSKSFKHPSIETYSIKQTTVKSKKNCKVTLQSFLERYWSLSQDQVCRQEIEITANTSTWSCSFSPQRGLLCSSDNTHKPTDTSRTDWQANIYFLYWVT